LHFFHRLVTSKWKRWKRCKPKQINIFLWKDTNTHLNHTRGWTAGLIVLPVAGKSQFTRYIKYLPVEYLNPLWGNATGNLNAVIIKTPCNFSKNIQEWIKILNWPKHIRAYNKKTRCIFDTSLGNDATKSEEIRSKTTWWSIWETFLDMTKQFNWSPGTK